MQPLVSIVIPTFNRARDLERALNSVIAQTYSHWEALVVDNHSSDNTDDVVKSFSDSRIKLLKINNDGVIAASRNLGIKHSQGEYIAFLDSDDWWSPQKLEGALKYLNDGADVVYHDMYVVTKAGQRIFWRKVRPRDLSSPVFEDLLLGGNPLANSGVVARKSVLQEIGGLCEDADLIAVEDYDAWLRVAKITDEFRRVPKVLGYYWAGGGNIGNPERTLKYLDAFERRYANDLGSLDIGAGFWWFNYLKGRAYYLSGFYGNAKKALDKIRWRQAPLQVAVKALWMRSMINLFHRSELRLSDS